MAAAHTLKHLKHKTTARTHSMRTLVQTSSAGEASEMKLSAINIISITGATGNSSSNERVGEHSSPSSPSSPCYDLSPSVVRQHQKRFAGFSAVQLCVWIASLPQNSLKRWQGSQFYHPFGDFIKPFQNFDSQIKAQVFSKPKLHLQNCQPFSRHWFVTVCPKYQRQSLLPAVSHFRLSEVCVMSLWPLFLFGFSSGHQAYFALNTHTCHLTWISLFALPLSPVLPFFSSSTSAAPTHTHRLLTGDISPLRHLMSF